MMASALVIIDTQDHAVAYEMRSTILNRRTPSGIFTELTRSKGAPTAHLRIFAIIAVAVTAVTSVSLRI